MRSHRQVMAKTCREQSRKRSRYILYKSIVCRRKTIEQSTDVKRICCCWNTSFTHQPITHAPLTPSDQALKTSAQSTYRAIHSFIVVSMTLQQQQQQPGDICATHDQHWPHRHCRSQFQYFPTPSCIVRRYETCASTSQRRDFDLSHFVAPSCSS